MARKRKQAGEDPAKSERKPTLRLEWRSPAELADNPRNWRTHPPEQEAALQGAMTEVGWAGACLYNERTGRLIDGHLRRKVAQTQGSAAVPVLIGSWSEEDEAKILATLDPLAGMAGADAVVFDDLLKGIHTGCDDLRQLLDDTWDGIQAGAIDDAAGAAGDVEEDTPPEPQAAVVTRPGDLWTIGPHRLLCGDCRDPRDVQRLTGGEPWDVVVLDPPFNATDASWAKWINDPSIVFGQAKHLRMIPERLWRFERVIVKSYRHRSATVQLDHRHAFVAQVGSVKHLPQTSETFPSVIQQDNETEHDHAKPVGLLIEHLEKWTPEWKTAIDPYVGSGTTIMACEALGRRCFACEIEPAYVDVCLRRYVAKYPDADPVRHDGVKWSELQP